MFRFSSMARRRPALAAGLALLVALPGAEAANWTVTTAQDDDGALCDVARCSLRAAIGRAQSGDLIVFADTLSYPLTIHLAQPLVVSGKTLRIEHPARGVTLDARPAPGALATSRVLEIHAGADVTVSGLALAQGRVNAARGGDGTLPGQAGSPGANAAGGCVLVAAGARLVLSDALVRDCQAYAGRGGDGVGGRAGADGTSGTLQQDGRPGSPGQVGGRGGDGGGAFGGAIYSAGELVLIGTSIVANRSIGGAGGNGAQGGRGGEGGNGGPGGGTGTGGNGGGGGEGGRGGAGGAGGSVNGGGVYVESTGSIHAVNSEWVDNEARGNLGGVPGGGAQGGGGGRGGVGSHPGEPGPAGLAGASGAYPLAGFAFGGALGASASGPAGLLSFVTVTGNRVYQGPTVPASPPGVYAAGGGLGYIGSIAVAHALVAANSTDSPGHGDNCAAAVALSVGGLSDSDVCALAHVVADAGVVVDPSAPAPYARLAAHSPAIDAAADCRLLPDGPAVAEDIRHLPRPQDGNGDGVAACDIGAFEVEGDVSEFIFRDGFGD